MKDDNILLKENDNIKNNLPIQNNNKELNQFLGKKREIEHSSVDNKTNSGIKEMSKSSKNSENKNSKSKVFIKKGYLEMNKIPFTCGEYFYFKKHQIGAGSFRNVFCGTHKIKNFKVAIKVPNKKANSEMIDLEIKYTKLLQKK